MIAIYARESESIPDGISSEEQVNACMRECADEYIPFVDNAQGKKNSLPAYKRLIKAVEGGQIDTLFVYSIGCISHSLIEFAHLWEILSANSTEFYSVTEKFDTSSAKGKSAIEIIIDFAKIERENIAQRIRNNYRERAKLGIYPGGPAPYGFSIEHRNKGGKSVSMLVSNDKISVVKEIFELYAKGSISLGKLARYLHDKGVPGINRKGWDNVSISRLLHNPVYVKADAQIYSYFKDKGIVIYNGEEQFSGEKGCWLIGKRSHGKMESQNAEMLVLAGHDGIVDSETFLKCQRRLDKNVRLKNTGNMCYTWLQGLVKCGYCGYSMQAVSANGGRYVYLICTGKTNFKVCKTKFHSPHVDAVEPAVSEKINERIKMLRSAGSPAECDTGEVQAMKSELCRTEEKIQSFLDALAGANTVTAQYINERIEKLDAQKKQILANMKKMLETSRIIELPDSDFESLSFEAKKKTAKMLIKKILLKENSIEIEWLR